MLYFTPFVVCLNMWCPVPGVGKYLEGGKDAGGQLVDQRFCPRIVEGAAEGLDESVR